jgi:uncharacterized repeat protein (TIGR01451 family)
LQYKPKVTLCIQDTTDLDFSSQPGIAGLGRLNYDARRGMYLHPTLMVTPEGLALGVTDAWMWARNASGNRLVAPVLLDFGTGTATASVPLDIVEPLLEVTKTALTPDRFLGQTASYEIRVFHAPNSAVAADVTVIDTLAPGLTLVPGSLVVVSAPDGVPVTIDGTTMTFKAGILTAVA